MVPAEIHTGARGAEGAVPVGGRAADDVITPDLCTIRKRSSRLHDLVAAQGSKATNHTSRPFLFGTSG